MRDLIRIVPAALGVLLAAVLEAQTAPQLKSRGDAGSDHVALQEDAGLPGKLRTKGDVAGTTLNPFDLPPGETITIEFDVVVASPVPAAVTEVCDQGSFTAANLAGTFQTDDPGDPTSSSDPTCTSLSAVPDLLLTKDDGAVTANPGDTLSYTLGFSNQGDQGATGVTLTETVPANTTFNPGASSPGWSCAPNGNAGSGCSFSVGSLAGGGAGGMTVFAVTVDGSVASGVVQIENGASAGDDGANGSDPTPGNNAASATTPLSATPDLKMVKEDGVISAAPGATLSYTLTFDNDGDQDASGVVVTETVPINTTFNATVSSGSWSCTDGDPGGTACSLAVGTLPSGGSGNATFAVDILSPLSAGVTQLSNTAAVSDDGSNGADPTPDDNASTETTPIEAAPDLQISKDDGGIGVAPGDALSYTLTFANAGNQDATGVLVSDTVPANTTFNPTLSNAGWSCGPGDPAGTVCTLSIGALAAGDSGLAIFAVDLLSPTPAGVSQISNIATIADDGSNGTDLTPADNEATDTTPLLGGPDLSVSKDDGGVVATPGTTLVYTLSYGNAGNRGASGVTISDTVPTHTTFNAATSDPGWSCANGAPAGTVCTLAVGTLSGGANGVASFAADVAPALPGVAQITNTASIADDGGNGTELDPGDNASTAVTSTDVVPPRVTEVSTTGQSLAECGTVNAPVESLAIGFNEDVQRLSGPNPVADPSSYLLVSAGPDLDFSTAGCATGTLGDDVPIAVDGVSYISVPPTATLSLNGGSPLADGLYQLFVCETIEDPGANPLDGDGNGVAGPDFSRGFRVDALNLFANGELDCSLEPWVSTVLGLGSISYDGADAQASPRSGSALISNPSDTGEGEGYALEQCVPVNPTRSYTLSGETRVDSSPSTLVSVILECVFFASAGCGGENLGATETAVLTLGTAGLFAPFSTALTAPAAASSARCGASVLVPEGDPVDAFVDSLRLVGADSIFEDGFESGNTSAWSRTSP